jgi:tetratricopeptide (TPR) repeat protein
VEFLLDRVAADPDDADAQLELGLTLIQRLRETADPSLYAPAEQALAAARRLRPDDVRALVGLAGIQAGKHDFAAALDTGQAALAQDPTALGARDIVFDALVELGRYDEAFAAIDATAEAAADVPTLARRSYAAELRGDLDAALDTMTLAAAMPGVPPENTAFALSIVGHLELLRGDPVRAAAGYDRALRLVPDHVPSIAGLARLAVGRGDLETARDGYARAAAILPLPEYAVALGETLRALGDVDAAADQIELARLQIDLLQAAGVTVDQELALIEADHGDPARALTLAEAAYAATPTIKAADALAWALHRVGRDAEAWTRSEEARRLGTPDAAAAYHAGVIADALGRGADDRELLTRALALDPGFSATAVADARDRLTALGD